MPSVHLYRLRCCTPPRLQRGRGWLEVCIADCAIGDFADATLAVSGEPDLYMQVDGAWKKWNPTTREYE